jgi:hypothetical protein
MSLLVKDARLLRNLSSFFVLCFCNRLRVFSFLVQPHAPYFLAFRPFSTLAVRISCATKNEMFQQKTSHRCIVQLFVKPAYLLLSERPYTGYGIRASAGSPDRLHPPRFRSAAHD